MTRRKKKNIQKSISELLETYLNNGQAITILPTIPMQYNEKLVFANGHTRPKSRTRGKQSLTSVPSKNAKDRSPHN